MKYLMCLGILISNLELTGQVAPAPAAGTQTVAPKVTDAETDGVLSNITFLNAANFDFSSKLSGSYLGKINIYSPKVNSSKFGFNAGILRIKFDYNDSTKGRNLTDHVLLKPLDSIKNGTKYLIQYNRYTTVRSNIVWSFYVQPMWTFLGDVTKHGRNKISLHAHFELLVNNTNLTTTMKTLQVDTSIINVSQNLTYQKTQQNPLILNRTLLNGYFGCGITFDVDPFGKGKSRFFLQGTYGITTNYPQWAAQDISAADVTLLPIRDPSRYGELLVPLKSAQFYLIRAEFSVLISKNSQLILGTDIRGILPRYNPQYAAYLGINLDLDALAKLVTGS